MLSNRLRAQVRRTVAKHLTQRCTIERQMFNLTDEAGGHVDGPNTLIESACFLTRVNRSSADLLAGTADIGRVYYTLNVPHDTDIRDEDVVVIEGERYRVEQVMRSNGLDVMRQALVVKQGS